MKQTVAIHLFSRQEDGDTAESTRQSHRGTLYDKNGVHYLLYEEAGFTTTLKLGEREVRLYRRGELDAWQVFQPGELTGGRLTLGGNDMVLRILTSHFELERADATGHLRLRYELFTSDSPAPEADPLSLSLGKFHLDLDWHVLADEPLPGADPGDGEPG